MRPNNICCIGGNHSGGLCSCVIALKCPEIRVVVVDNEKTISEWNSNRLPFNEPGLDEILKKCRHRNLFFSSNYASSIRDADLIFIAINVPVISIPLGKRTKLDFTSLEEVGKLIATYSESDKIVVERSRVSSKGVEVLSNVFDSYCKPGVHYNILSNPISLSEGSGVNELLNPPCIFIGFRKNRNDKTAAQSLSEVYEHWVPPENIKIVQNLTAELGSIAGNVFLSQKVSNINALATICEESDADLSVITNSLYVDSPQQAEDIKPSLGSGKFQKDVSDLIARCESLELTEAASYWQSVLEMNYNQAKRFTDKVKSILDPINGKQISILGFAQSKDTRETKFSPAVDVCKWLLSNDCSLKIYDPQVPSAKILSELERNLSPEKKGKVLIMEDVFSACTDTSALIVCTDWDEFRKIDFQKLVKWMQKPVVIDGHRMWNEKFFKSLGLEYYNIYLTNPNSPNS